MEREGSTYLGDGLYAAMMDFNLNYILIVMVILRPSILIQKF